MAKDVEIKIDLGASVKWLRQKTTSGMEYATVFIEGVVKRSFQPGHGRTYIRHGKEHKASAPGEPPAVDTGRLRSSITHAVETTDNEVIGYVGSNVEYAKWLELGTERVAERPFLRPALFNNQAEIAKKFIEGAKR